MPVVRELFGARLGDSGEQQGSFRDAACPHMGGALCDGGGNRDMARWPAAEQPLASLFDAAVGQATGGFLPCGVCSVQSQGRPPWAICPRRLLMLHAGAPSAQQERLRGVVLRLAGFGDGEEVRVWSEVSLRAQGINYRLDYVLRCGDRPPVIVEVMTASTSGGNRGRGTDIKSAFVRAVLYANGLRPDLGDSPGVNARQVWARMMSQMIVKSEIANHWGGRTIWVVQDVLMDYIRSSTGLRAEELDATADWRVGEVNVVSANLDDPNDIRLYAGPIASRDGSASWSELVRTPSLPDMQVLTDKLGGSDSIATLTV